MIDMTYHQKQGDEVVVRYFKGSDPCEQELTIPLEDLHAHVEYEGLNEVVLDRQDESGEHTQKEYTADVIGWTDDNLKEAVESYLTQLK